MVNLQFIQHAEGKPANGPATVERSARDGRRLASSKLTLRFWRFGLALALCIGMVLAGVQFRKHRDGDSRLWFGHDLIPSYTAGTLVRSGNARLMYDRQTVESLEARTINQAHVKMEHKYGPWLNPPFFAWFFVPLARFEYRTALAMFVAFNAIAFVAALLLLKGMLSRATEPGAIGTILSGKPPMRVWSLVPLLVLIANPTLQVIGHQQNTFISLLLLSIAVALARRGSAFSAGLVAGLLLFKPQLAVLVAMMLVVLLGWRAVVGVATTGLSLLAINLITLPGTLSQFQARLPLIVHWLQKEIRYNWGRQITFTSFWRLLIQGHEPGEHAAMVQMMSVGCSMLFAIALGWMVWRQWSDRKDPLTRDRMIAAAIVSMPLVMPYYMDYDLALLAAPAVLLAAEWIRQPEPTPIDRWTLRAWVALYLLIYINPGLAGASRFNLAVPALAAVAGLSIARCYNRLHVAPSRCRSVLPEASH